jgi:hypothetical protein
MSLEEYLNKDTDSGLNLSDLIKACTITIDLTCKDKVIKVLNISLMLLNLLITNAKIEQN